MPIRFLYKVELADGSKSYTFSRRRYEYESSQDVRPIGRVIAGASYAFVPPSPVLLDVATETVRSIVLGNNPNDVDEEIDKLKALVTSNQLLKIYTVGEDSTERWAYARLESMPEMTLNSIPNWRHTAIVTRFRRFSDWFGLFPEVGSISPINTSPFSFTIYNPGNVATEATVFEFRSLAAPGFLIEEFINLTNEFEFSSTTLGQTTAYRLKVNTETGEVLLSTDGGVTFANDLANFTRGATQVAYMRLEPGENDMRYTDGGTPSLALDWTFFPAYR